MSVHDAVELGAPFRRASASSRSATAWLDWALAAFRAGWHGHAPALNARLTDARDTWYTIRDSEEPHR